MVVHTFNPSTLLQRQENLAISVQQPLLLVYISETFSESAMDMCVLFDTVSGSPTWSSLLPTNSEN